MGSTGYRNMGFREAIRYELGGFTIAASGAGLGDEMNSTWFALDGPAGPFICLARWRTYGRGRTRETVIKLISEDMGPFDVCVPENVWTAAEPAPFHLDEIARAWRSRVSDFRRQYPHRVRDLDATHVGQLVAIPSLPMPVRYLGNRPHRRDRCQVFDIPGDGERRLPSGEERVQRCAVVTATGTGATR